MNTGELAICAGFLEEFLHGDYTEFIVSTPVKEHTRLEEFHRFVFVSSGELLCDIGVDGRLVERPVREHGVIWGLPGGSTGSSIHNDRDGAAFTVGFFPDYIRLVHYRFEKGRSVEFHFHHTFSPLGGEGMQILDALQTISTAPQYRPVVFALLRAILEMVRIRLTESDSMKIGKSARTWQRVEEYINDHLADVCLTRKKLASAFRMNGCYLSALCHEQTGHTLNGFILQRKLSYALLLLEQKLTVKQIAAKCGINQTSYFIRLFRRTYGTTPAKYRSSRQWMHS